MERDLSIQPLEAARFGDDPYWTPARVSGWTTAFVVLGLMLRLLRYALKYPLWGDEAFLAENLIDRGFLALMKPLDYTQVCPLFFLWIEEAVTLVLGFNELSLRLIPTVASIAGLLLFRHVAGRIVKGPGLILAVAILAVGYAPVRHGGEVKPYSTDFLMALSLLSLAIEWVRAPWKVQYLWGLAFLGPFAVGLSHPAIFVAASIGFVLLVPLLKTRKAATYVPFAIFGLATVATFLWLLKAVNESQSQSVMDVMSTYWSGAFPPRKLPDLLVWLVSVHTSHMFSYPAGGDCGASSLTTGCVIAATVAIWRRGSRTVLALLFVPFGLGIIAATLGRYPYGGSARTMQYVAPAICLMAGLGGAALLSLLRGRRPTRFVLLLLFASGLGMMAWDVFHPYKSEFDGPSRDFARRLWTESDADLACARTDFQVALDPKGWRNDRSALYLCHQAIYSPRHRNRQPVPMDQPLRCVVFQEKSTDLPGVSRWLQSMNERFILTDRVEIFVNKGIGDRGGHFEDRYVIYAFVPRDVASSSTSFRK